MPDQEAIDALAEAWAVVNGDERVLRRPIGVAGTKVFPIASTYREDATRAVCYLRSRGFDIVRKE